MNRSHLLLLSVLCLGGRTALGQGVERPNVLLIITDDQGYGDFGFANNPLIDTPNLDRLAEQSARVEPFYVSPVCAPTRACLMTGRYNYRTRVVDTWIGRAMMEPAEVTMAESLRDAGYATGMFGKWHLGDCHPMRPQDQGFDEVLMHRGGGIGQSSDPPGGERRYTDPILFHNGEATQVAGYCTDIYAQAAIDWMKRSQAAAQPFFCYLATNAPHGPYHDVPQALYEKYRARDLSNARSPHGVGHPLPDEADLDRRARIFAMIENIDQNVGRVLGAIDELGEADNTLVLFMVDNGPQFRRYVTGFAGKKGGVREGGIRSPLLARWPGVLIAGHVADRLSAHIDLLPTVLDACGIERGDGPALDGRSFWPALRGEEQFESPRHIVIQAHRGDEPQPFHHFMIRNDRWKLLRDSGFGREQAPADTPFELYDLISDPFELHDLSHERPDVVARLKETYQAWWDDVSSERPDNFAPPRIVIDSTAESTTVLTRQDWRRLHTGRNWASLGAWHVEVAAAGSYDVLLRFTELETAGTIDLEIGSTRLTQPLPRGISELRLESVPIADGPGQLLIRLTADEKTVGPHQVEITGIGK